jgi:hypothetical protein
MFPNFVILGLFDRSHQNENIGLNRLLFDNYPNTYDTNAHKKKKTESQNKSIKTNGVHACTLSSGNKSYTTQIMRPAG